MKGREDLGGLVLNAETVHVALWRCDSQSRGQSRANISVKV